MTSKGLGGLPGPDGNVPPEPTGEIGSRLLSEEALKAGGGGLGQLLERCSSARLLKMSVQSMRCIYSRRHTIACVCGLKLLLLMLL